MYPAWRAAKSGQTSSILARYRFHRAQPACASEEGPQSHGCDDGEGEAEHGQPLSRRHGYPARIIVPGLYGEKHVKWIDRIHVSARDEKGYYERNGWGPDFVVQTQCRFTAPDLTAPTEKEAVA